MPRFIAAFVSVVLVFVSLPVSAQTPEQRMQRFGQEMQAASVVYQNAFQITALVEGAAFGLDQATEGLMDWDRAIGDAERALAEARRMMAAFEGSIRQLTFTPTGGNFDSVLFETERYFRETLPTEMREGLDLLARDIEAAKRRDRGAMDRIDEEWDRRAIRVIEGENVLLKGRLAVMNPQTPDYHLVLAMLHANEGFAAALTAIADRSLDSEAAWRAALGQASAATRKSAADIRAAADRAEALLPEHVNRFRQFAARGIINADGAMINEMAANYVNSIRVERGVAQVLEDFAALFDRAGSEGVGQFMASADKLAQRLEGEILRRLQLGEERTIMVQRMIP